MAGRITHRRCTDNLRDRLVSERRYQWDRADQIIRRMYTDGAPSTPAEKYRQSLWGYDAAGRMTQSLQPEGEERFWYDAADNRTTPEMQPVWNNLLKRLDGVSREYDGFGRMTVRHDTHRRVTQRFSYDDEHRISRVEIDGDAEYTRAEYRYDALGRRTEKQVWRRHARKPERTQYAWSGLQMVGETSDSHPDAAVQYIYSENSFEPLARVDSHGEYADIFWYHTELNGLPDSVTDSNGDTIWRGASTAWGRSLRESTPVNWDTPQNLRFQGQYLDRETGLHYNTFRYYDPAAGCYTQMDPIGLLGGLNTYTYVVDPLVWVDPLGLCKVTGARQVLDPESISGWDKAESMYEKIRLDSTDINLIAKNTGWKESAIARIKEHVFFKEHMLDRGLSRFDADPGIVNAWDRLKKGDYLQKDIDLLRHEQFESKFEGIFGTNYRVAHDAAIRSGRVWE